MTFRILLLVVAAMPMLFKSAFAQGNISDLRKKAEALKIIREHSRKQVREIANYSDMTVQQQSNARKRIEYWLTKIYKLQQQDNGSRLPDGIFDIYAGLIHVAEKKNEINLIRNWQIAYLPNINFYYQIYYNYYKAWLKYGSDTPLPEVLMGIMNIESHYRWVKGDDNLSEGPCQLNRRTARWLLQRKDTRKIFSNYIYFDQANLRGNHHFFNQDAMVAFMYDFLVKIKGYRRGHELQAIATYNGSGVWDNYSRLVKKAIASYVAYERLFHNRQASPGKYSAAEVRRIRQNYYKRIFPHDKHGHPYLAYHYATENSFAGHKSPKPATLRPSIMPRSCVKTHYDAQEHAIYLHKQPNRSLFSYFRGSLTEAVAYHNRVMQSVKGKAPSYKAPLENEFIYLYYITGEGKSAQRHYIRSKAEYKKAAAHHSIHTNFSKGKIYLKPSVPVFYPKMSREPVCKLEQR